VKTFEEAAQTVAEEFVLLVQHVVRDDDYNYGMRGEGRVSEVLSRVVTAGLGADLADLERIVSWVLFVTSFNAEYERLSPEETRVREIALDLRSAFDRARAIGPERLAQL
jgi:hypothetical protein